MQNSRLSLSALLLAPLLAFYSVSGFSHGEGPWNDFMIDNKNTQVEQTLEDVKQLVGDIVLERRQITSWPDPELQRTSINIVSLQEEVNGMLNHMKQADDITLQLPSTLKNNPQAGRSVTGSDGLEIALELVDYITGMESQEAFANDLNEDGITAYMFDLMDTYLDKMLVYSKLQQTKAQLVALETTVNSRTATQDFKYHLGKLLQQMGFDGLAESLADKPEAQTDSQAAPSTDLPPPAYGGALN